MGAFGSAPASAPFPATMYPASSFFGATGLQPGGTGAASDDKSSTAPMDTRHMVVFMLALIVVGYLAYHFVYLD